MKIPQYIKTNWGKCPFCNEKPETAPHIGNFCFPVCWRCLSLSLGIIIPFILISIGLIPVLLPIWAGIIIMLPAIIDGLLEYGFDISSTNLRRILTGLIAGYGIINVILHLPNPL